MHRGPEALTLKRSDPATTRLFIVRHGLVDAGWRGRLYGGLDVELSAEGREQARQAARILRPVDFAAVAASDLERAVWGAERIAEGRNLAVRRLAALREIARGDWAGRPIEVLRNEQPGALEAWFADPEHRRPPGGESVADLRARALPALEELASDNAGQDVAIVAHGWVLRAVVGWVLGLPSERLRDIHVPPASITAIDWPVGSLARCGARLDADAPHRDRPYLVGLHLDRRAPAGRGWYRAPG